MLYSYAKKKKKEKRVENGSLLHFVEPFNQYPM